METKKILNHFINLKMLMSDNKVSSLYQQYIVHRSVSFNEEEFTSILAFFPVLMLAASYGIVDREE